MEGNMIKLIKRKNLKAYLFHEFECELERCKSDAKRMKIQSRIMVDTVYQQWCSKKSFETEPYSFDIKKSNFEPSILKNNDLENKLTPKKLEAKSESEEDKHNDQRENKLIPLPQIISAENLPALFKEFPDQFPSLKHPFPVTDPEELAVLWNKFDDYEHSVFRFSSLKNNLYRPFAPKIIYRTIGPFGLFYNRLCFSFTRVLPLHPEIRTLPFKSIKKVCQEVTDITKMDTDFVCSSSQSKSSLKITDLPDDILLNIFDHFTLQFKFNLRAVSQKFTQVIDNNLICRKKSLKLFSSKIDYVGYCKLITSNNLETFEHIKFKDIPADDDIVIKLNYNVPFLSRVCSNLEALVVYFDKESQLQSLPDFLANLDLKSLSLLGEIENSESYGQTFVNRLASAISQMTKLTHLDILVKNLFSYVTPSKTSESGRVVFLKLNITSIMNQLEVFSLYGRVDNIKDLLSVLGPNCSHLQLESTGLTDSAFGEIVKKNPGITKTIKKLVIRVVLPKQIKALCTNFTSLSSLELFNAKQTSFEELIKYINNIKSLTDLRIGSFLKLYNSTEQEVNEEDVQPMSRTLPQVRRLTIESMHSFRNHTLGAILEAISEMFPNLEKINLGSASTLPMDFVFADLDNFETLVEFRLFYTGKLQSYLIPSHQMIDFVPDKLAKHYLYKKTENYWEMIEEGFLPREVFWEISKF